MPGVEVTCRVLTVFDVVQTLTKTFFLMAQPPLEGHGLLTVEASRSHSDTQQPVGLLWTSDQLDAETST